MGNAPEKLNNAKLAGCTGGMREELIWVMEHHLREEELKER